jgi:hypothetical protein
MRLIHATFVLLLVVMTSAQCQQTAEDWTNKGALRYFQLLVSRSVRSL